MSFYGIVLAGPVFGEFSELNLAALSDGVADIISEPATIGQPGAGGLIMLLTRWRIRFKPLERPIE